MANGETARSLKPDPARAMTRGTLFVITGIVVVAVAARIAVFQGYAASDDADYAATAWSLAQGHFPPTAEGVPPHYPTRLGLLAPAALLFRVFGVSETTLLLLPLGFSAAMMVLVFAAARTFYSTRAAVIALALCAIVPIECRFATWLLTDVPAAFWSGAGVLAVFLGHRRETRRARILLGLVAAACFGLAWLTRDQVVHLAPFVAVSLIVWSVRDRRNLWLAGACAFGVMVVFVAEGLMYQATHGDFLYRLHIADQLYTAHQQWYFKEGAIYGWEPGHYAWGLARRLLKQGPAALLLNFNLGLVPLAALIACAHQIVVRRRPIPYPVLWFLYAAFMFNFGSASLKHYEPLPWIDAYLMPMLLPGILVAGGWMDGLWSGDASPELRRERRFLCGGVGALLLIGCAFGLLQQARQGIGCPVIRAALPHLPADGLLYTDPKSARAIEFFRGFPAEPRTRDYSGVPVDRIDPGARVFINEFQLERLHDILDYTPPDYVKNPPAGWTLLHRLDRAALYQGGAVSDRSPTP